MSEDRETGGLSNVVRIDDERIRDHLGQIVRGTVEDMLNSLLAAEADRLCNAGRYERTEARRDVRSGTYPRQLHTRAGEVTLRVPKLRRQTSRGRLPPSANPSAETAIIERYRRRESSVEEALIEMYLAGVSVRRVEDITEALWGTRVSPGTVSNLSKKIYQQIEAWRNRPILGEHPYVYLDGVVLKRSWAGEVRNVSLLVAIGVSAAGYREILGICEGAKEDKAGWSAFLAHLKQRGLSGVQLVISDACLGLVESVAEFYPEARWQRRVVHFYRNVFSHVPATRVREVAAMLKAIHAQEDRTAAQAKAADVVVKLRAQRLKKAAELLEEHVGETLTYYAFPDPHWRRLRTTTRWNGSSARSAAGPAWSAPSRTVSRPSTWQPPGSDTSRHPLVDPPLPRHEPTLPRATADRLTNQPATTTKVRKILDTTCPGGPTGPSRRPTARA